MHHGIGYMVRGEVGGGLVPEGEGGQRSTTSPPTRVRGQPPFPQPTRVRGQPPPPPPPGSEVNHLSQGQKSTTPPGSEVNHLPHQGQRLTTSSTHQGQSSTTPSPRMHSGTTVNLRVLRILLECILVCWNS